MKCFTKRLPDCQRYKGGVSCSITSMISISIRLASKDNAYASDYGDISLIKDFADRHSLAVIVVHHIRKQNDSDVFNKVSSTTRLTGSADATFVLEQESRASNAAKLYVTGRDTPYQEFKLRFRDCSWELVERKEQEQLAKEAIPDILFRLVDFLLENHIRYDFSRRSSGRLISLARQEDVGNDGHDDDDGIFGISPPLPSLRENTPYALMFCTDYAR